MKRQIAEAETVRIGITGARIRNSLGTVKSVGIKKSKKMTTRDDDILRDQ